MWSVFSFVAENLGVSFEFLLLFVVIVAGIIFMARDVRIGLIIYFVFFSGIFVWFYEDGSLAWQYPLILFFITLILLAFSIFSSARRNAGGVV